MSVSGRCRGDPGAVASSLIEIGVIVLAASMIGLGTWSSVTAFAASSESKAASVTVRRVNTALTAAYDLPNSDDTTGYGGLDPNDGTATRTGDLLAKLDGVEPGLRWQQLHDWDYTTAGPLQDVWIHLWEGCSTAQAATSSPLCDILPAAQMVTAGIRDRDGSTYCVTAVAAVDPSGGTDAHQRLGRGYMSVGSADSALPTPAAQITVDEAQNGSVDYPWQNIATCAAPGSGTIKAGTPTSDHWLCDGRVPAPPANPSSTYDDRITEPGSASRYATCP